MMDVNTSGDRMRKNGKRNGIRLRRIVVPALCLAVLLCAFVIYAGDFSRADDEAIGSYDAGGRPEERMLPDGSYAVGPADAEAGFVFYPGGKVEHRAYLPLARSIASGGVLCVVCRMPFRLAVLGTHAADRIREMFPDVGTWYLGGHSLGGAVAAIEASKHTGAYEGMVLLAAYSTKDLSGEPLRALSAYGSEDGVLDREKYASCRKNLPADAREIVIGGGCHAGFGMYGPQKGDGVPLITHEEQIRFTAGEILAWMGAS